MISLITALLKKMNRSYKPFASAPIEFEMTENSKKKKNYVSVALRWTHVT